MTAEKTPRATCCNAELGGPEHVCIGSLWRRNPPGREVVEVRRMWWYYDGPTVRAHPRTGGKPLITSVDYLRENYTEVTPDA